MGVMVSGTKEMCKRPESFSLSSFYGFNMLQFHYTKVFQTLIWGVFDFLSQRAISKKGEYSQCKERVL